MMEQDILRDYTRDREGYELIRTNTDSFFEY
jgi:hypothetical protein